MVETWQLPSQYNWRITHSTCIYLGLDCVELVLEWGWLRAGYSSLSTKLVNKDLSLRPNVFNNYHFRTPGIGAQKSSGYDARADLNLCQNDTGLLCIKDLEKSLKSEWLPRRKNKSYYMNLKLIIEVIKAYNSYFYA